MLIYITEIRGVMSFYLHESFKELINSVPSGLTDYELSIYLYLKMNQYFSYDINYNFDDFKLESTRRCSLEYIKSIELNSDIVCFEFAILFSNLLSFYNIENKVIKEGNEEQGYNHFYNEVITSKFELSFDSTINIAGGDLVNAKINSEILGVHCDYCYDGKYDKLNEVVIKIQNIALKHIILKDNKEISDYFDINDVKDLNSLEKIKVMIKLMEKYNFKNYDALGYLIYLKSSIFNNKNYGKIMFEMAKKENETIFLFVFNKEHVSRKENNIFLIYDGELNAYSFNELVKYFIMNNITFFRTGLITEDIEYAVNDYKNNIHKEKKLTRLKI